MRAVRCRRTIRQGYADLAAGLSYRQQLPRYRRSGLQVRQWAPGTAPVHGLDPLPHWWRRRQTIVPDDWDQRPPACSRSVLALSPRPVPHYAYAAQQVLSDWRRFGRPIGTLRTTRGIGGWAFRVRLTGYFGGYLRRWELSWDQYPCWQAVREMLSCSGDYRPCLETRIDLTQEPLHASNAS